MVADEGIYSPESISPKAAAQICVCVCTYKRPEFLKRLLWEVNRQATSGLFSVSIAVVDNDAERSAEAVVAELRPSLLVPVSYDVEPQRSIARARNRVVAMTEADYLAFIDDDEFPAANWLLLLFTTCREYKADGVLGPVLRHFEQKPPEWLQKSRFFIRPIYPTGLQVAWHDSRTSNALVRRETVLGDEPPFRPQFRAGEDQDFFRRKTEQGFRFVWSDEAVVYETIPPNRWTRVYQVRRALLQGACEALQPSCDLKSILKSMIAIPLYMIAMPFALLFGQHYFMSLLEKFSYHAGKLLKFFGINPIREEYVS
jgi:glycosyltransferase involved in cell wall biosynthesis